MEVTPLPPGWPDNLQCCGETGRYDLEFAAQYSWSAVVLSWSSPKRLDVRVTLRSCVKRDPGDCALTRVVDNESRGEYKVAGSGIRIGVTILNPELTSARLELRAIESQGVEMRPSDSCLVL